MVLLLNTVQEYITRMPHLNYISGGVVHTYGLKGMLFANINNIPDAL